jgi:beta-glucanase (GH16 family)
MYPYQHSRKALFLIIFLGFLGSIFLSAFTSNIRSAKAYYPSGDLAQQNRSIPSGNTIDEGAVVAPVQKPAGDVSNLNSGNNGNPLALPADILPASTPIPPSASREGMIEGSLALDVYVAARNDDAEERVSDGRMNLTSTELDLVVDPSGGRGAQTVGMRFTGINIPKGSTISQAYIEFQVSKVSSGTTSLAVHGQAANNAATFSKSAYNISNRVRTSATMNWTNIEPWGSVGATVRTPDLSGIVQEIVNRSGWASGNSMAFIFEGDGRRIAAAFESNSLNPALLHIVYLPIIPTNTPTPPPPPNPSPTQPAPTPTQPAPTPTDPPATGPTPVGQTGDWVMKFDDEFNGGALDTSKWRTCFWWADATCSIESNHEMELYNPEDVLVQDGHLRLRAQKRDMVAWNGITYHYTSGMVMTGGRGGQIPPSFSFIYGFAEALVKVPAGQGLWPAFWTLSADYQWPPEIDIMEILGNAPNEYHMNYHYNGGDAGSTWTGPDFSAGWHVLGLDWRPDAIVWYVDGIERWRFDNASRIINEASYLLLNLAVGGDWPGPPNNNTTFPSYFDIDYVRVWQRP